LSEKTKGTKCFVAVRIRGTVRAHREARETLKQMHLTRNNYAVLIDDRPAFIGMLRAAQSYITWGDVSKECVGMMLHERGRLAGNRKLSEEYLKKAGYKSLEELAEKIHRCAVTYQKLPGIQPVFRLRPPTKGFKGNIKKSYRAGGELGYRGEDINELVKRMT